MDAFLSSYLFKLRPMHQNQLSDANKHALKCQIYLSVVGGLAVDCICSLFPMKIPCMLQKTQWYQFWYHYGSVFFNSFSCLPSPKHSLKVKSDFYVFHIWHNTEWGRRKRSFFFVSYKFALFNHSLEKVRIPFVEYLLPKDERRTHKRIHGEGIGDIMCVYVI